ncbi:hypothetical protein EV424DRAFT_1470127 [Suillus variegatus]|nr:hypothetical protein EV424DRAFT_1470127 [Suillus variegatus]
MISSSLMNQIELHIYWCSSTSSSLFKALVSHIESQLCVDVQWEIGSEEYNHFKAEASLGKYYTALDELECLVMMRLFELSKLLLSGTALQQCSEAICKAIICYNIQASALNPPHEKISWKDITNYSFLGEFDLLWHSCSNVQKETWAKPAYQEATSKYFKLLYLQATAVIPDLSDSVLLLASKLKHPWHS